MNGLIKNIAMIKTVIFMAVFSIHTHAYVHNRGFDGKIVKWGGHVSNLNVQVNSSNSSSLSRSQVENAFQNSLNRWNGQSRINVSKSSTTAPPILNVNDLFFSSSSLYFNSNDVIAITQVSFNESNGEILEGDIILNDNYNFSSNTSSSLFLEDIFSHELGHFLGLSHSQLHGATMFFELKNGQDTLSEDDKAGAFSHYPNSSSKGTIRGKIVGGSSLTGVFGAQVRAISTKTGKVIAGAISNTDGSFDISGLPLEDQYYIYVSPTQALATIPSYFADVKDNFCDSRSSFRGSFYQSCSSQKEGFPQAVPLSSSKSNLNIGNITIRCGLDVPGEYLSNKISSGTTNIDVASTSNSGSVLHVGNAFVGFYTGLEADNRTPDNFQIDLSSYNLNNFSDLQGKDLYLDIKVVSQSLFSQVQLDMEVTPIGSSTLDFKFNGSVNMDSDGNPDIDLVARIPLDENTPSENVFDVKLTPRTINSFINLAFVTEDQLFPAGKSNFNDDLIFYFVMINVSSKVGSSYESVSMVSPGELEDNSLCPDGNNTFTVAGNTIGSASPTRRKQNDALACGSVGIDGGPGSGPFNVLLGFCLALLLSFSSRPLRLKR